MGFSPRKGGRRAALELVSPPKSLHVLRTREEPYDFFCYNVISSIVPSHATISGSVYAQCPHYPLHTRQLLPVLDRKVRHLGLGKEEELRV